MSGIDCGLFMLLTVTRMYLRVDLHSAVFWNQLVWYWHSFKDRDALIDDGVVFHTDFKSVASHRRVALHSTTELMNTEKGSYFDMLSIRSILTIPNQCRI